jgi:hypothetical protein
LDFRKVERRWQNGSRLSVERLFLWVARIRTDLISQFSICAESKDASQYQQFIAKDVTWQSGNHPVFVGADQVIGLLGHHHYPKLEYEKHELVYFGLLTGRII